MDTEINIIPEDTVYKRIRPHSKLICLIFTIIIIGFLPAIIIYILFRFIF